jgi:hypothetical protein
MAARRRRRRRGLTRLAVAVALLVAAVVIVVLIVRGCGGEAPADEPAATPPPATATATTQATTTPGPASSPPLVKLGGTVRFETPEGAVVRVTAGGYADPGDAPAGASAEAGERLVTLQLTVTAEGPEGTAAVRVPFEDADSFLLIAEDDTITVAQLGDDALLGATLRPGEPLGTTLAFSVGDAAQLRFVCTPAKGSQPRSATWELD